MKKKIICALVLVEPPHRKAARTHENKLFYGGYDNEENHERNTAQIHDSGSRL